MNPDQRNQLEKLLEAWFVRLDAGEAPDAARHCAAHPELCGEFVRLVRGAAAFDELLAPRPRADAATAPPPDRLGDYELVARIGQGGAGEVWLARQTSLRRLVALKLVKHADTPKARRRLRREAEVAASLDHPGIVPIYAVGEQDALAWIAMKWLTGPALDDVDAPLPPERAARLAAAAARALHEAHRAGIVHRDVKPSNIVLDGDNPCLVDFGLARDGDEVTRTTAAGHVSGTLLYMSPEQLRSGDATATLDARTDVYSLGATLYELLAGRPPFTGDHPGKVIHQILDTEPAPLRVARDLATIVLRALDKDRERRFRTALEMALDLERYLAGEPILSRPVGVSTRIWRLAKRNRIASALIGGALLLAAGFGVSFGWTVYERARLLDVGVARVKQAIATNDLASAEALLSQLVADDAGAPEVQEAQRQLVACQRLDELLDRVQALPEDADPAELRSAAEAITASDLPEQRRLEHSLARPLALAICGDLASARTLADALPPGRSRDALRAAIASAEIDAPGTEPWQLQDGTAPIDHLITALAMRFAQRPLAERRVEIDLARRLDESDWRVRLQNAIQLVNEQSHASALAALVSMPRPGGFPRIVRRLMMFEAFQLGDVKEARFHLRAFLARHPPPTWTAADAAYLLDVCYWLEEPAGEILTIARRDWPHDRQIAVLAARAIRATDPVAARELLAASVGMARTQAQRDASELTALWIEVFQMTPFWFPWDDAVDAETLARLRDVAQRAESLAAKARSAEVRLAGGLLHARARLAAGDMVGASAAVSRLDTATPGVVLEQAQQAFCHWCVAAYVDAGTAEPWQVAALSEARQAHRQGWQQQVRDVRPRLASALASMPPNQVVHGQPARFSGWLLAALLALAEEDTTAARAAADAARKLLPADAASGYRDRLNYVESELGNRGR